mgnify:FL=1
MRRQRIAEEDQAVDDRRELTDTLSLVLKESSFGYRVNIESSDTVPNTVHLEFLKSTNLKMSGDNGPSVSDSGPMKVSLTIAAGAKQMVCRLDVVDKAAGACNLDYNVTGRRGA